MSATLRQRMHQDLQLAGLAEGTQTAYLRVIRQLAAHFSKAPDQITEDELRAYLPYLKNERKYQPSSLKIAASGIIFFYTHAVPRDWPTLQKIRFPRPDTLPDVLSIAEVRRLIDAVRTPHNKTYFWTVYSLGLRLQESLNLQVGGHLEFTVGRTGWGKSLAKTEAQRMTRKRSGRQPWPRLSCSDTDWEFSADFDRQASATNSASFLGLCPPQACKTVSFFVSLHRGVTQSGILFLVSIERGTPRRVYHRRPWLSGMSQLWGPPCRFLARPRCTARRCRRTEAR